VWHGRLGHESPAANPNAYETVVKPTVDGDIVGDDPIREAQRCME
jgi:hypothetical protein